MKNATKLTLASTVIITSALFILYLSLMIDIAAAVRSRGVEDFSFPWINENIMVILLITAAIAFVINSILVDQLLNPIRLMIAKVKELEKMNSSSPLRIPSGDDELREYADAFNHMSQSLRGYIERQKRFISDASHELTTPITVINGHADLLLRRHNTQPELLDEGLTVIKAEVLRMSELVDSLLLLTRSDNDQQEYAFEKLNLSLLIHESIAEAKLIAPDFIVESQIDEDIPATCDPYTVKRLLRILFNNAVKYASECRVRAYTSHSLAYIIVSDNGIGIAAEHLPRIFDRFYRVDDSRTKKTGSSGLGLAIAQEIVHAHGGEIRVESEIGKGTTFTVMLPS
jgi:signal transduction histidine kinase